MSFLSHVHVGVTDIERARRFYDPLMRELGLRLRNVELGNGWIAWKPGDAERPLFIIGWPWNKQQSDPGNGPMTAFLARSREVVDRCYALALASGGTDEGRPGLRPNYHPNYYGAYFRDPDGNKLCVACHEAG